MRMELYHAHIDRPDRLFRRLWEQLPPARRAMLTDRTPADRIAGTALSALLSHAVHRFGSGERFQTVPTDALTKPFPRWETAANGKPFPAGIDTPHGRVFASVSHSGAHLLVALCDRPLGADIQMQNVPSFAPARFPRLAARMTHPAETPPATPQEAARRFSAKEAVLKLSGDGLRRPMNTVNTADFSVYFCEEVPACIIAVAVAD